MEIKTHEYFTIMSGAKVRLWDNIGGGCSLYREFTLTEDACVCAVDKITSFKDPGPALQANQVIHFYRHFLK